MKVKSLSRIQLLATPWTAAYQAPPFMGFSRLERVLEWVAIALSTIQVRETENQFSSLILVQLFVNPWAAVHQASLSITHSQSLFKLMSVESVIPSNHLILCRPLLLLPSVFSSIRVFSNE